MSTHEVIRDKINADEQIPEEGGRATSRHQETTETTSSSSQRQQQGNSKMPEMKGLMEEDQQSSNSKSKRGLNNYDNVNLSLPTSRSKGKVGKEETSKDMLQKSARIGRIYRVSTTNRFEPAASNHPTPLEPNGIEGEGTENDATWKDVMVACCCHSSKEWMSLSLGIGALLVCLYFFLLGLELLGTAFKVVGGCTAGSLLGSDTNPLASLCIGIIATAILQSSSTTTAIVVSLVSGGLDVKQAIYLVMGANVGTSVTSMIVSLAHMGDGTELERAFAGASILCVFNLFTLIILFPMELIFNYLYRFTEIMLPASVGEGEKWEGPIKKIVSPLANLILMANSDLIADISTGDVQSCDSMYPVTCQNGTVSYETCQQGLIGCSSKTGICPVFFQDGASKDDDMVSGWVCLILALFLLIVCLIGLVSLLKKMLLGASTRIIYKATNINGYLAILIGAGVTILVQSSSITASALTPLCGIGVLKLENMFPLILGSDIGTTITALLAAMVSSKVEALQIALCHVFFNVTGVIIWYPLPFIRKIPLAASRKLGKVTRKWRNFPILFIGVVFFLLPILLLGISSCFEKRTKGFTALGVFFLIMLCGGIGYFLFWWSCQDGHAKCRARIKKRQRKYAAINGLAEDLDYIKVDLEYCKNEIGRLKDFAGLINAIESGKLKPGEVFRPASLRRERSSSDDEEEYVEPTREEIIGEHLSVYGSVANQSWAGVLAEAGRAIETGSSSRQLVVPSSREEVP
jgi:sodium-dependent phosphate cotransporter